jgi:hypothetical protein
MRRISEPETLRTFLRDTLGFPYTDVGGGWLIFDLPEADMGCHPTVETAEDGAESGTHSISFYCDDVEKTVEELKAKGVEFTGGDRGPRLRARYAFQDARRRARSAIPASLQEELRLLSEKLTGSR